MVENHGLGIGILKLGGQGGPVFLTTSFQAYLENIIRDNIEIIPSALGGGGQSEWMGSTKYNAQP